MSEKTEPKSRGLFTFYRAKIGTYVVPIANFFIADLDRGTIEYHVCEV